MSGIGQVNNNRSLGGRTRDGDWCRIRVVRFGGETVENVSTGGESAHARANKRENAPKVDGRDDSVRARSWVTS